MTGREIKLISSMATAGLLGELVAEYQRNGSARVSAEAAGGVAVAKRIREGEAADVVVLAADVIDELIAEGRLLEGSRLDLVRSGVAIAVRAGAKKPDISSEAALRAAVLTARSISYSTGPSGAYLNKLFEGWGILDAIGPRIVIPPPGTPVGSFVAAGSAELGFQQLSELLALPGIDVIGPLPPSIQSITVFSGGIPGSSGDPAAARDLLEFLASPGTAATKRRYGMDNCLTARSR